MHDTRIARAATSRRGTPGQVLATLLIATAIGVLFASTPLAAWTKGLPDGPLTAWLQTAANQWHDQATTLGLTRPYDRLHTLIRDLQTPTDG